MNTDRYQVYDPILVLIRLMSDWYLKPCPQPNPLQTLRNAKYDYKLKRKVFSASGLWWWESWMLRFACGGTVNNYML